jgi:hypothetical protein
LHTTLRRRAFLTHSLQSSAGGRFPIKSSLESASRNISLEQSCPACLSTAFHTIHPIGPCSSTLSYGQSYTKAISVPIFAPDTSPKPQHSSQPVLRVPSMPSIRAPHIPSVKAPRVPSIKTPSIPHRIIPGTTRYTSPGRYQGKKQTGNEYPISRNVNLLPGLYDGSSMALRPTLQVRQESESVSSSEGHCVRMICSPPYLARYPSQGCITDLLSTEYTMSFPDWPLVLDTDGSKRRSADDSTMKGTTSATTAVAHVAMVALVSSPLEYRQCGNGLPVSSGCTESSHAEASTISTGGK